MSPACARTLAFNGLCAVLSRANEHRDERRQSVSQTLHESTFFQHQWRQLRASPGNNFFNLHLRNSTLKEAGPPAGRRTDRGVAIRSLEHPYQPTLRGPTAHTQHSRVQCPLFRILTHHSPSQDTHHTHTTRVCTLVDGDSEREREMCKNEGGASDRASSPRYVLGLFCTLVVAMSLYPIFLGLFLFLPLLLLLRTPATSATSAAAATTAATTTATTTASLFHLLVIDLSGLASQDGSRKKGP
jgi:hypothetical protein